MAKASKKKQAAKKATKPKERGEYDDKIAVNGSFMDILKASGKHANNNSAKKKAN
jgi:hypothetical protein